MCIDSVYVAVTTCLLLKTHEYMCVDAVCGTVSKCMLGWGSEAFYPYIESLPNILDLLMMVRNIESSNIT